MKTQLLASHGAVFVLGLANLSWLAFPLASGPWRFGSHIHWGWLLVPCVLLGLGASICQGGVVGFGRFWPTVIFLIPASLAAWWVTGIYVSPTLFGSDDQPTPDLFVTAVTGWVLYVAATLLVTLVVGAGTSALVESRSESRAATTQVGHRRQLRH